MLAKLEINRNKTLGTYKISKQIILSRHMHYTFSTIDMNMEIGVNYAVIKNM